MRKGMDRHTVERLAVSFLTERLGMEAERVADLIEATTGDVSRILAGGGAPSGDCARRIDALAATQSLLLSGYTPDTAVRWMKEEPITPDGLAAVDVLRLAGPDALGTVLHAAYARASL